MRRLLALAGFLAFLPIAHAQDKAKTDISVNGEYRLRWLWAQNPGANDRVIGDITTGFSRLKVNTDFKATEKLTVGATALHNAYFGQDTSETQIGYNNGLGTNRSGLATAENLLTVNEAYLKWRTSDDFTVKIGRQTFQIADGYVMGVNDFEALPYSLEGIVGTYDMEFAKIQAFAFKYRDWIGNYNPATPYPAAGSSAEKDPEHNAYGLNFDLKTMPEWLKALNVHVIKDNADAITGATSSGLNNVNTNNGQDILRYGLMAHLNFGIFDLKGWYAAHTGTIKEIATGTGVKTELDSTGNMMQAEAAVLLKEMAYTRFWVRYHVDSGDKNSADGKAENYDPYLYEMNPNTGGMNLHQWGNMTYLAGGFSFHTSENTQYGAAYWKFSRTETGAASQAPTAGSLGVFLPTAFGDRTKDELGDEIDVYVWHSYGNGLSTILFLGYVTPGEYYASSAAPLPSDDNGLLLYVTGTLNF